VLRTKLAAVVLTPTERDALTAGGAELRALARRKAVLGEGPALLAGTVRLSVPVYVVWGEDDDVRVLERLRAAPSLVRATTPPHTHHTHTHPPCRKGWAD
jgi:pimeloyl-ACP methyl ester carboxylesterase